MDEVLFQDENVGWPSYVDFLATFSFILILFVGSLLYIISGDIRERLIQMKVQPYARLLTENGVNNIVDGQKVRLPLSGEVEFDRGEWVILPKHIPYLRRIGRILAAAKGSKRIVVLGFADSTPFANDPFGNWKLSSERALSILQFFYNCMDCGYGEEVRRKLTLTGEGNVDAKETVEGNSGDRRVDIIVEFGIDDGR